jgi:hypothetical protein
VIIAIFAAIPLSAAAQQPPRHPKYPQWITNYEAGRALAKTSGKPMFVVLRCEP